MGEAVLYKKSKLGVRCLACCHRCLIKEGGFGICGVRKNIGGKLFLLVYDYPCSINVDPIEKKPLYHFLPGTLTYSIGTVGCNFRCDWCQNYSISQASKPEFGRKIFGEKITAEEIVENALKTGCKSIAYTYNEPAIWSEYIKTIATLARKKGLCNVLVTNGYFTLQSLQYLKGFIDAVNVDLKSFSKKVYTSYCGAKIENVLENIRWFHKNRVHLEITTLLIPGINDSNQELNKIASFIASIDKDIPWHVSRYFPMYKFKEGKYPMTPLSTLRKAEEIGKKVGLKHIYMGNI